MAPYRQACPGCAGGQAVAAVDAERHTRKAERYRRTAAEAAFRADHASIEGRYEAGVQGEAAEDYRGEAALYTALADRSEQRAKRALARLIEASPRRCFVCGDSGQVIGNGSAAVGGNVTA